MTTPELKKLLIHRITEIDDISFLNILINILESKTKVLLLSPEQKNEIMESKHEIENGLFVDQENFDEQVLKWASVR
ncbi:MAG: hypothetical protein LW630_11165 [Saprospiraceae bacterium]|jgi:hypothetical protein|nr:hypothetical protein [Saprospiraceae bacterium]